MLKTTLAVGILGLVMHDYQSLASMTIGNQLDAQVPLPDTIIPFNETLHCGACVRFGYYFCTHGDKLSICCKDLRVGQIVKVHQNERVPADLLLLYTTEKAGSVFIRTDQLDGETDWKHRKAVPVT